MLTVVQRGKVSLNVSTTHDHSSLPRGTNTQSKLLECGVHLNGYGYLLQHTPVHVLHPTAVTCTHNTKPDARHSRLAVHGNGDVAVHVNFLHAVEHH